VIGNISGELGPQGTIDNGKIRSENVYQRGATVLAIGGFQIEAGLFGSTLQLLGETLIVAYHQNIDCLAMNNPIVVAVVTRLLTKDLIMTNLLGPFHHLVATLGSHFIDDAIFASVEQFAIAVEFPTVLKMIAFGLHDRAGIRIVDWLQIASHGADEIVLGNSVVTSRCPGGRQSS
jgi:hypothetical protein